VLTVLVQGGLTSRLLAEALQLGRGTAAEQTAFDIACAELENCLQEEAQRLKRNEPLLAGALHSTPNNIVLLPDPFIQIAGNHVVVSLHAL
jgi:ABC-type transporter Mla subunit MlaD